MTCPNSVRINPVLCMLHYNGHEASQAGNLAGNLVPSRSHVCPCPPNIVVEGGLT